MPYNILLVDDNIIHAHSIQKIIERDGKYKAKLVGSDQEAIDLLINGVNNIDLVLLDVFTPAIDGIKIINAVKPVNPHLPIIVNSGYDDVELVTSTMKAGAVDYIKKSDDEEKLRKSIESALRSHFLNEEVNGFKKTHTEKSSFKDILGNHQYIKEVRDLGAKVASSNIPVLIEGENGCGKELLARSIHLFRDGVEKPFITVNCGAIPANLVESILFGHEKGAFTGALYKTYGKFREADGGTIFLDEVGELAPEIQVKLLRVLQDGEIDPVGSSKPIKVNVRLISATNRDLATEVKNGNFREDLYYRLNVFPIYMPSLRSRKSDMPMLIKHFISLFMKSEHKTIKGLTAEAEEMLCKYSWPGNIRQLKNTIFRAVVLCEKDMLGLADFPQFKDGFDNTVIANSPENLNKGETVNVQNTDGHFKKLNDIEKQVIESALKYYNGRMSEVSRRLGIGRSTLYRKLESYGVAFDAKSE